MEITSLRTLVAVVDEGGIRGASGRLNTVQSNITARIHKLEKELDAKLFRLVGRRLELTPAGELLYDYAEEILRLEHQATSAVLRSKGSYDLRIGTAETFAAVHLPLVLKTAGVTGLHVSFPRTSRKKAAITRPGIPAVTAGLPLWAI